MRVTRFFSVAMACSASPLYCDGPGTLVASFMTPSGVDFRHHNRFLDKRPASTSSALTVRALSSAPSLDGGKIRRTSTATTDATAGEGASAVRAKEIASQARRRARDVALERRLRDREAQQTATARIAPPRRGGASEISPPSPPPQRSLGSRLRGLRRSPAKTDSEEADEIQRRVRAILDEYSTKAPPAEQWPPGRRIRVRGVEFHYKDTGSRARGATRRGRKDRPTFVLLHGLAGSTASWDEVVTDLSEYGRVISFDRVGFGKTERVMPPNGLPWRLCSQTLGENPYSADFTSKALFGILDRLGVDKIILVAHSLGAQIALRAARARPEMIRAMVLVAPAVLNPLDSKFVMGRDPNANLLSPLLNLRNRVEMTAKLAAFNLQLLQPGEAPLETVRNMTLNGDVEARVQQNYHDRSLPTARPELISKYIEPLKDPLWDRGLLYFYKSLQGEVQPGEQLLQKALEVWKGPAMIITGDDDPTIPLQSSIYVAEEMEGRLVVMESCAHIPMDEKSEVFTSAVLSFASAEEVREAWAADGNSAKAWW